MAIVQLLNGPYHGCAGRCFSSSVLLVDERKQEVIEIHSNLSVVVGQVLLERKLLWELKIVNRLAPELRKLGKTLKAVFGENQNIHAIEVVNSQERIVALDVELVTTLTGNSVSQALIEEEWSEGMPSSSKRMHDEATSHAVQQLMKCSRISKCHRG
ncbi:hypothetical protein HPP92_012294 [Vanilla planifolia]|uniref:Uncharacterized protein n=1 Tax=Vanilla planifolia TaxID=51239 RepID=A0A835QQ78_VANPL|nr:hypothetical protein HPP92_012294 [Vanilla planifolia]